MKRTLLILAGLATSAAFAAAAEYTTFRVCEDQHVLRTSDGADAGHVEYIVVDPSEHRVVSTVVTGGVLANRTIVVPIDDFEYSSGHEVRLRSITRERLVSAPVIEESQHHGHSQRPLRARADRAFSQLLGGRRPHERQCERGRARADAQ